MRKDRFGFIIPEDSFIGGGAGTGASSLTGEAARRTKPQARVQSRPRPKTIQAVSSKRVTDSVPRERRQVRESAPMVSPEPYTTPRLGLSPAQQVKMLDKYYAYKAGAVPQSKQADAFFERAFANGDIHRPSEQEQSAGVATAAKTGIPTYDFSKGYGKPAQRRVVQPGTAIRKGTMLPVPAQDATEPGPNDWMYDGSRMAMPPREQPAPNAMQRWLGVTPERADMPAERASDNFGSGQQLQRRVLARGKLGAAEAAVRRAVLPNLAAGGTGAMVGALTAPAGPWVSLPATIIAGALSAGAADQVQQGIESKLPYGQARQGAEAELSERYPKTYGLASAATGITTGNPLAPGSLVRSTVDASGGVGRAVGILGRGAMRGAPASITRRAAGRALRIAGRSVKAGTGNLAMAGAGSALSLGAQAAQARAEGKPFQMDLGRTVFDTIAGAALSGPGWGGRDSFDSRMMDRFGSRPDAPVPVEPALPVAPEVVTPEPAAAPAPAPKKTFSSPPRKQVVTAEPAKTEIPGEGTWTTTPVTNPPPLVVKPSPEEVVPAAPAPAAPKKARNKKAVVGGDAQPAPVEAQPGVPVVEAAPVEPKPKRGRPKKVAEPEPVAMPMVEHYQNQMLAQSSMSPQEALAKAVDIVTRSGNNSNKADAIYDEERHSFPLTKEMGLKYQDLLQKANVMQLVQGYWNKNKERLTKIGADYDQLRNFAEDQALRAMRNHNDGKGDIVNFTRSSVSRAFSRFALEADSMGRNAKGGTTLVEDEAAFFRTKRDLEQYSVGQVSDEDVLASMGLSPDRQSRLVDSLAATRAEAYDAEGNVVMPEGTTARDTVFEQVSENLSDSEDVQAILDESPELEASLRKLKEAFENGTDDEIIAEYGNFSRFFSGHKDPNLLPFAKMIAEWRQGRLATKGDEEGTVQYSPDRRPGLQPLADEDIDLDSLGMSGDEVPDTLENTTPMHALPVSPDPLPFDPNDTTPLATRTGLVNRTLAIMRGATGEGFGRLAGKKPRGNPQGVAYTETGETGLRDRGDYHTAIHEMMHHADRQLNLSGQLIAETKNLVAQGNRALLAEFRKLAAAGSVPPKGVRGKDARTAYRASEAISMFAQSYAINPQEAVNQFPEFSRWFLNHPGVDTNHLNSLSIDIRRRMGADQAAEAGARLNANPQQQADGQTAAGLLNNYWDDGSPAGEDTSQSVLKQRMNKLLDITWRSSTSVKALIDAIAPQYNGTTNRTAAGAIRNPMYWYQQVRDLSDVSRRIIQHGGDVRLIDGSVQTVESMSKIPEILTPHAGGYAASPALQHLGDGKRGFLNVASKWAQNRRIIAQSDYYRDQATSKLAAETTRIQAKGLTPAAEQAEINAATALIEAEFLERDRNITGLAELTTSSQLANLENRTIQNSLTPDQMKAIDDYANALNSHARRLIQLQVESGRYSQEEADKIASYGFYVPLRKGEYTPEGEYGISAGARRGGVAGIGSTAGSARRAKGGASDTVQDPYLTLVEDTSAVLRGVMHNQLMLSLKGVATDPATGYGRPELQDTLRVIRFTGDGTSATGLAGIATEGSGAGSVGIPIYKDGRVIKTWLPEPGVVAGFENGRLFFMDLRPLDAKGQPVKGGGADWLARMLNYGGDPVRMSGLSIKGAIESLPNPKLRDAAAVAHKMLTEGVKLTINAPGFFVRQITQDNAARALQPTNLKDDTLPGSLKTAATAAPNMLRNVAQGIDYTVRGNNSLPPGVREAAGRQGIVHNEGLTYNTDWSGTGYSSGVDMQRQALGVSSADPETTRLRRIASEAWRRAGEFKPIKAYKDLAERGLESARVKQFQESYQTYLKRGASDADAEAQAKLDALKLHNSQEAGLIWQWLGREIAPMTAGHADGITRTIDAMVNTKTAPAALTTVLGALAANWLYHNLNGTEKEYLDIPPDARARNWSWIGPDGTRILIPMAHPMIQLNYPIEYAREKAYSLRTGYPMPSGGAREMIGRMGMNLAATNPHSLGVGSAIAEVMWNKNQFDNPIIANPDLDRSITTETNRASSFANAVSPNWAPWQPEAVDHIGAAMLGSTGRMALGVDRARQAQQGPQHGPRIANTVLGWAGAPIQYPTAANSNWRSSYIREAGYVGEAPKAAAKTKKFSAIAGGRQQIGMSAELARLKRGKNASGGVQKKAMRGRVRASVMGGR